MPEEGERRRQQREGERERGKEQQQKEAKEEEREKGTKKEEEEEAKREREEEEGEQKHTQKRREERTHILEDHRSRIHNILGANQAANSREGRQGTEVGKKNNLPDLGSPERSPKPGEVFFAPGLSPLPPPDNLRAEARAGSKTQDLFGHPDNFNSFPPAGVPSLRSPPPP